MSPEDPRHGTYAGANAHWVDGEQTCELCRAAATRYAKHRQLNGQQRTVPATGVARRIRALQRIGWPLSEIAVRIGWNAESRTSLHRVIDERKRVTVDFHNRVAAVYDELSMTLGPSVRSRNYGIRNGWPSPLSWDDIDSDDEPRGAARDRWDETSIDEAIVERVLAGSKRPRKLTSAEAAEIVVRSLARGMTGGQIETLYGLKPDRYVRGGERVA